VKQLQDFLSLGIKPNLQETLNNLGIYTPTPVQEQAIPNLMGGEDVIAQAQTGTGKTISFILPILERINFEKNDIQALIVSPTRELAIQITNEFNKLKSDEINVLAVYGGQDVDRQLKRLAGTIHIVVATPGRLLDHVRRGSIHLEQVSMLVLDEADQMLHIGFINEVEAIIKETTSNRQTMLFSATLSPDVIKLAKKYMKNPVTIRINEENKTVEEIKQIVYETTDRAKQATLHKLLQEENPFLAVIFCRTKRRVSKLYEGLKSLGVNCDELHGDLSQAKRERVLKRFRQVEIQYLIATDVAARGLDVEGVTHVFNYDIPEDVDSYIHRIGRTGRAGGEGVAITLVAPKDVLELKAIEKGIGITLPRKRIEVEGHRNITDDFDRPQRRQERTNKGDITRSGSASRGRVKPRTTESTGQRTSQKKQKSPTTWNIKDRNIKSSDGSRRTRNVKKK
jgi:ATP-dependent RNA helicase DeaD